MQVNGGTGTCMLFKIASMHIKRTRSVLTFFMCGLTIQKKNALFGAVFVLDLINENLITVAMNFP
jgi:hypothetical protein